jgi:peptide/nickel transport system substrate-binding protein
MFRRLTTFLFAGVGCAVLVCIGAAFAFNLILERTVTANQPLEPRIVYGLTFNPSGFDPHINQNAELGIVYRSVYDTLLYRNPDTRQFEPGLATNVEISPDGLSYTFALRQGVKFHDGETFDAYAVAATLDRIVNPETRSQKSLALLGPYSRYEVVDAMTIRIILNSPYAPLLDAVSQVYLGIASPKALTDYDAARYQFHQVGTGPFVLVDYVPGDKIVLRRNPDYAWGPSFYKPVGPNSVKEIEFRFFTDSATRAPALQTGDAQVMGELAPADALIFSRGAEARLIPQPIPGQPLQFFMNTTAWPTNDFNVRRAILLATDRTAIVDSVYQQFSPVAYGPLSAASPYYEPRVRDLFKPDKAAALDLLRQAGYTDLDNDGMLEREETDPANAKRRVPRPLKLIVITPPWGFIPQVVQKLQSQWKAVGIGVEIRQVPNFAGIMGEYNKGDYNLLTFYDSGLDPSLLNRFFRSDGAMNFTRYTSTDLDTWLDAAMKETGSEQNRAALYAQAQMFIMENALILPIRDIVNLNGAATRIDGLTFDAYGWFPVLNNITVTEP